MMSINILFLLLLSSGLYASESCEDIQKSYILGDYKKCVAIYNSATDLSPQCRYISALCNMANNDYENARYELSILSVPDKKTNKLSNINALALNSLAEVAYLKGDYNKARSLSTEINSVLSKKLPDSYEYAISEVLLTKSYLDVKDSLSANKRINLLKQKKIDPLIYYSIAP